MNSLGDLESLIREVGKLGKLKTIEEALFLSLATSLSPPTNSPDSSEMLPDALGQFEPDYFD
jgi:hypothetical protein